VSRRWIAAAALACSWVGAAFAQPAAAAASAAAFGSLPLQRGEASAAAAFGWGEMLGAIVLLAVLLGALQYVRRRASASGLKWWPAKPVTDGLRARQAVRLTPAASVHVLQWGSEELLVACTGASVTLLARRPQAADDASPEAQT
jgi:flagellar biogenesis protein FliO